MVQTKRPRSRREMPAVHPDAAAIDVGATMHVVAVPPDRDPEPVRTFGTFTGSSANRVGNFRDSEAIPVFDGDAIADW